MKLFGQVLIIAVCIYAVSGLSLNSAVNNVEQDANQMANEAEKAVQDGLNSAKNIAANIVNKIHGILHPNKPSGNTADTCYASYIAEVSSVNDDTVSQSQDCYIVPAPYVDTYTQNINSSLAEVSGLSQKLQAQLAACAAKAAAADLFSCYVSTFDESLKELSDLTVKSELAVAYLNGYQSQLEITQSGCLATVVMSSKANSTLALNTLETCVDDVNKPSKPVSKPATKPSSGSSSSSSGSASASNIQVQIF